MIVVDTTVIADLLVHPKPSEPVERLLKVQPVWASPDLWRAELVSVMWKYIRAGKGQVSDADQVIRDAEMILGGKTYRLSATTILSTSLETGISTYDAHFVALAQELGTVLYTHDRQLVAKCAPGMARNPSNV